jgi:hypothetical protein
MSKSGTGRGTGENEILTACPVPFCGTKQDRAKKDVLKQKWMFLKRK